MTRTEKQAGVTREAIYIALREGRLKGHKGKRGKLTAWAVDQESLKSYIAGRN